MAGKVASEKSTRGTLRLRREAMREVVTRGSEVYLGLDISSVSWHVTARTGGETVLTASFPPTVDMGSVKKS
jgi:hypothetical protein